MQRPPALRARGPGIAFPPGLKAGIPCEDQGMAVSILYAYGLCRPRSLGQQFILVR